MAASASAYEVWVRWLRTWAEDPTVSHDHLPMLDETSYPVAIFERFATHLSKANQKFTDRWADQLATRLGQAPDPFTRAQVMVDAKRLFARRLQLAQHPGLPATLRQALWDGACQDTRHIQAKMEESGAEQDRELGSQGRHAAFFRDHSLVTLIAPGFPLDQFVAGLYQEPHSPEVPENAQPDTPASPVHGTSPRVIPNWQTHQPEEFQ